MRSTLDARGEETERIQAPCDLRRTQTWTSFREPAVLKYEKDSTNALLTGLACTWDGNRRITTRTRMHDSGVPYDYGVPVR